MPAIDKVAKIDNLVVATFKNIPQKDDVRTKAEGRPCFKDFIVCELKFAANKQTVGVYPAHEVFKYDDDPETGEREPLTYALAYPKQWAAFLAGEHQSQEGTPLSELAFLSQSKRLELKSINIHTAEALAAVDGKALKMLGQGGRTLKDQAQAYIENAGNTADVSAYAAENVELRERIAALEAQVNGKVAPAAGDDADDSADDSEGDEDGEPTESPFVAMEPADIVNWLLEATKGMGRKDVTEAKLEKLKKPKLIGLADEVNAALAAAKNAADAA